MRLADRLDVIRASIAQRAFSDARRQQLAESGAAMMDGSYPIVTRSDLTNAVAAYGRAKNKSAVKAHIIRRARALKATNLLPDAWRAAVTQWDPPHPDPNHVHQPPAGPSPGGGLIETPPPSTATVEDGKLSPDPTPQRAAIVQVDALARVVTGIVQTPDTPTLSYNRTHDQWFNIVYPKDAIRDAAWGFLEDYLQGSVAADHAEVDYDADADSIAAPCGDTAVIVASFVAPCDLMIGDTSVPDGSWVVSARIRDEAVWERVLSGELAAFSLSTVDYDLEVIEEEVTAAA